MRTIAFDPYRDNRVGWNRLEDRAQILVPKASDIVVVDIQQAVARTQIALARQNMTSTEIRVEIATIFGRSSSCLLYTSRCV